MNLLQAGTGFVTIDEVRVTVPVPGTVYEVRIIIDFPIDWIRYVGVPVP
jgi:hypothetical protein